MISAPVPLSAIKEEYRLGSEQVLKKLEWLEGNGWDQVWRARGDGDCFYRCRCELFHRGEYKLMIWGLVVAITIAYLLRILHSPDPPLAANLAFEAIQRALPAMQEVGFDSELVRSPCIHF